MRPIALVLAALVLGSSARADKPPRAPDGFTPLYEVLGRRPDNSEAYLRAWWVHRDPSKGIAYVVIPKRVPMHVHLDADHVMTVVEGAAMVTLGGGKAWLGVGDTINVPRGMAHEIQRAGVNRLVMLDVSTPVGDMEKTFWIEPPPAARAPGPSPATAPAAP